MKPTITSILALLIPLAATANVCPDRAVGVGWDQYKHGALIANDCNVFYATVEANICDGWGNGHEVKCYSPRSNETYVETVKITKGEGDDQTTDEYLMCERWKEGDEQCDNGAEVKWCCRGSS